MINEFIKKFTDKQVPDIVRIRNQYFQLSPELEKEMNVISKSFNKTAYSAGIFLGEEKGKRFFPSIALIDILAEFCKNYITVDEKAEWLFLCGRDILSNSVIDSSFANNTSFNNNSFNNGVDLRQSKSRLAIVLNKRKEVLGYGLLGGKKGRKSSCFLENLLDRGAFLRKEMHKTKN
jgi:ribosome biogenesis protein Nip4